MNQVNCKVIGTPTTPITLAATYDTPIEITAGYFNKLALKLNYIPLTGESNRYVTLKVEFTSDDGVTWQELSNVAATPTETDIYDSATLDFPADHTTTGGVTYTGSIQIPIACDKVRISVKESGSSNFGTMYVRGTLQENSN